MLQTVGGPGEFVKAIVEVVGLVRARAAPGFVFFGDVWVGSVSCVFFAVGGVQVVEVPASMSISVMGLPLGSYMGFASTSILEDLIAGYEEPNL